MQGSEIIRARPSTKLEMRAYEKFRSWLWSNRTNSVLH